MNGFRAIPFLNVCFWIQNAIVQKLLIIISVYFCTEPFLIQSICAWDTKSCYGSLLWWGWLKQAVCCMYILFHPGKYGECHTCNVSCKTCFGPQALDCSSCFKGNIYCFWLFRVNYLNRDVNSWCQSCECGCVCICASQDISWTRTVPA